MHPIVSVIRFGPKKTGELGSIMGVQPNVKPGEQPPGRKRDGPGAHLVAGNLGYCGTGQNEPRLLVPQNCAWALPVDIPPQKNVLKLKISVVDNTRSLCLPIMSELTTFLSEGELHNRIAHEKAQSTCLESFIWIENLESGRLSRTNGYGHRFCSQHSIALVVRAG
jgi:hypothetical protein